MSSNHFTRSQATISKSYTFGDSFCGCGGASSGARAAGLDIKWGFDSALDTCESFQLNFPEARIFNKSHDQFATNQQFDAHVDILHLSPPCQVFCRAHTTEGVNDQANLQANMEIGMVLEKVKPRIVTMENTEGLNDSKHNEAREYIFQQFDNAGYSYDWKVIDLRNFGIPQHRERLILIGAGPGETLPKFPVPTHSKDPQATGLKPWTTVNTAIAGIPDVWPDHDINARIWSTTTFQAWSGNLPAHCVMTHAGNQYPHPSGTRAFTLRELACLQTFPMTYNFCGNTKNSRRMQIGNAVPPDFYKALTEEVLKSLRASDTTTVWRLRQI